MGCFSPGRRAESVADDAPSASPRAVSDAASLNESLVDAIRLVLRAAAAHDIDGADGFGQGALVAALAAGVAGDARLQDAVAASATSTVRHVCGAWRGGTAGGRPARQRRASAGDGVPGRWLARLASGLSFLGGRGERGEDRPSASMDKLSEVAADATSGQDSPTAAATLEASGTSREDEGHDAEAPEVSERRRRKRREDGKYGATRERPAERQIPLWVDADTSVQGSAGAPSDDAPQHTLAVEIDDALAAAAELRRSSHRPPPEGGAGGGADDLRDKIQTRRRSLGGLLRSPRAARPRPVANVVAVPPFSFVVCACATTGSDGPASLASGGGLRLKAVACSDLGGGGAARAAGRIATPSLHLVGLEDPVNWHDEEVADLFAGGRVAYLAGGYEVGWGARRDAREIIRGRFNKS